MKKKNEVLQILNEGGFILVDSIYRTARVYADYDDAGDSCRYDVADRIAKMPGYSKEFTPSWNAVWTIRKEEATEDAAQEPEKTAEEWAAESDAVQAATLAALAPVIAAEEEPAAEAEEPAAPEYLGESWPESNTAPGICYVLEWNTPGSTTHHTGAETVADVLSHVQQIRHLGGSITKAVRFDRNAGTIRDFIPETAQEKTDRENREYCKRIAEELELYATGDAYKCPHCGEVFSFGDWEETEHDGEIYTGDTLYTCPHCGQEVDADELEQLSIYDYFSDALDIEYRCSSDKEYRSVCVMVACGGPNIYIDTEEKAVLLYWWTDRARYHLSSAAVEAVDAWAEEYWNL